MVLDGKALRGSRSTQLVGAINAQSGGSLGVEAVADKSNEIPTAQTLLDRLELDGILAQLARLDRIRELKIGRQQVETVWIITSLSAQQADTGRMLDLARLHRSIENGTHYRLDVSSGEDRCRVRHPIAATVLGILRRAVQGVYRAWARRRRNARDSTCPAFQERMSRRADLVLRHLIGEVSRL